MVETRGEFGNLDDGAQLSLQTVGRELVKIQLIEKTKRVPQ
jgi:hypothetical protein